MVGGAYGGFCSFDSHSGMFTYLSYRGEWWLIEDAAAVKDEEVCERGGREGGRGGGREGGVHSQDMS